MAPARPVRLQGRARRRARRGMSLVEVLVTMAILVALVSVVAFGYREVMGLEQREVAKKLANTYELLHDEAVLRNVTFRVAYDLRGNSYKIEVGDAKTLIFSDPEARAEYEEERRDLLKKYTRREIEAGEGPKEETKFQKLTARFATEEKLPRGTRFAGIYTPQYDKLMTLEDLEEPTEGDQQLVYSYIFPNGFVEHTVVQLVEDDDPESGFTIEVEPLSGRVHLRPTVSGYEDSFSWVPSEGPDFPN